MTLFQTGTEGTKKYLSRNHHVIYYSPYRTASILSALGSVFSTQRSCGSSVRAGIQYSFSHQTNGTSLLLLQQRFVLPHTERSAHGRLQLLISHFSTLTGSLRNREHGETLRRRNSGNSHPGWMLINRL